MTKTALLVIDVQQGLADYAALGNERSTPGAEENIAHALAFFRGGGGTVIHVRHATQQPGSRFNPQSMGFKPISFARERPGEAVVVKTVNSAFIGTSLEFDLRSAGIERLFVCGATTNQCVETTVRMSGNLEFDTVLLRDACFAFGMQDPDGGHHSADDVHLMSLANLANGFAEICTTLQALSKIQKLTDFSN